MSRTRLLIAVSSPWASEKLAEPVIDLARRLDAECIVTHVARQKEEDDRESDAVQRGEQTLQLLTDQLTAAGLAAESLMLFSDDVAKAIVNTAHARQCTLIVVGLTQRPRLKRLISGDVPSHLARLSDLPLMLCPPNWSGRV